MANTSKRQVNTDGLKEYLDRKSQETADKVKNAISRLKRSKMTINFTTVAKEAGVAKATLYNNDVLRMRILSLRDEKTKGVAVIDTDENTKLEAKDVKIKQLQEDVRKLKADEQLLIQKLADREVLLDEIERLLDVNQRLEKEIQRLKAEPTTVTRIK